MSSRPKIAKASLARLGGIADNLTSNGLATALTLRARRPSCRCRRNRILFAYRLGTGKTCRAQPPHVARRSWRHDGDGRLGVERVAGGTTVVRRPLVKGGAKLDHRGGGKLDHSAVGWSGGTRQCGGDVRTPGWPRAGGLSCCVRGDSSRRSAPGCGRGGSVDRAARRSAVRTRRSRSIR